MLTRAINVLLLTAVMAVMSGCKSHPKTEAEPLDPSTQPAEPRATDIPVEQAQASYWLSQPAGVSVTASDFDHVWEACSESVKDHLFVIESNDPRSGMIITRGLVSKQAWEFWRNDVTTWKGTKQSTVGTVRRTVYWQVQHVGGDQFTATPKVVVERLSKAPPRVTSVALSRRAIGTGQTAAGEGPTSLGQTADLWYAFARDTALEQALARNVAKSLGTQPQEPGEPIKPAE